MACLTRVSYERPHSLYKPRSRSLLPVHAERSTYGEDRDVGAGISTHKQSRTGKKFPFASRTFLVLVSDSGSLGRIISNCMVECGV
jgi:hypothetical protein